VGDDPQRAIGLHRCVTLPANSAPQRVPKTGLGLRHPFYVAFAINVGAVCGCAWSRMNTEQLMQKTSPFPGAVWIIKARGSNLFIGAFALASYALFHLVTVFPLSWITLPLNQSVNEAGCRFWRAIADCWRGGFGPDCRPLVAATLARWHFDCAVQLCRAVVAQQPGPWKHLHPAGLPCWLRLAGCWCGTQLRAQVSATPC
jgi:hypothetical protein